MTTTIPNLPEPILITLNRAIEAIRAEQAAVITAAEQARIDRVGRLAARRNGEGSFLPGHLAIMKSAFGPERTCECFECHNGDCQADCSQCGDTDCTQCHPEGCDCDQCACSTGNSCCGWCSDCDEHHDDDASVSDRYGIDIGRSREEVCTACEHVCTQM